MSVLVDPARGALDEAIATLPEGIEARRPPVGELTGKLRDPRRAVKAQALAVVAQEVVVAIGEVTLR